MPAILPRLRDRFLSRSDVRARLGRFPIGRQVADRHARRLFELVAGFAQSQMLAAALELGLFDRLADGPAGRAAIDAQLNLERRGADALVQALLAMALIERRGERLALTIDGWVVATDPGLQAMIRHNRLLYADLGDPVAMLRHPGSGKLGAFWPYEDAAAGDAPGYSELMTRSLAMVSDAALAATDFSRFAHVMDVGGGEGMFLERVAGISEAQLTLVERPAVLARARARLERQDLARRISLVAATPEASYPGGADAICFLRVLHDHDDDSAVQLLTGAAKALARDGTVIIAEPVALAPPDPQAAYFAAYFAAMGSGRLRSRNDLRKLLRQAELVPIRGGSRSMLCNVMLARHR